MTENVLRPQISAHTTKKFLSEGGDDTIVCDECPDKNIKNSLRQHRLLSKWLIPCVGKKDALRIFYDEIGSIRNVPGIFKYDALDPRVERSRTFFKIRRLPMKIYECGIPDNKKTSKGSTSRLGMAKYLS